METLTLSAPAKINYLLDVIAKRSDGYHDLRMIMQRVNLCDQVSLTMNGTDEIIVTCNTPSVPDGQKNIAWKAAKILLELSNTMGGVTIELTKNIPSAAGLGGGSSDAAAVLIGLNKLLEIGYSDKKLMEIGCTLGADVPFFIFKETAVAEGIGEKLTLQPNVPKCWILLINPGIHISTAWVYQSLPLTKTRELNRIPEFFESIEQVASILSNDLEAVTISAFPIIAEIKSRMINLGAIGSMMSGSGPTVFGIFKDFESAEVARYNITKGSNWFSATVETL